MRVVTPPEGWWTIGGTGRSVSARKAAASATSSTSACGLLAVPGRATLLSGPRAKETSRRVTARPGPCTPAGRYTTA